MIIDLPTWNCSIFDHYKQMIPSSDRGTTTSVVWINRWTTYLCLSPYPSSSVSTFQRHRRCWWERNWILVDSYMNEYIQMKWTADSNDHLFRIHFVEWMAGAKEKMSPFLFGVQNHLQWGQKCVYSNVIPLAGVWNSVLHTPIFKHTFIYQTTQALVIRFEDKKQTLLLFWCDTFSNGSKSNHQHINI